MVSTKHNMSTLIATGTASVAFVLLSISFAGLSPSETFAQGTNATNTASGAGATNATGVGGSQTTVVMPLGSSAATSGVGYEPHEVTVSSGSTVVWDNQDNALHTATSGEPSTPDGKFDTGIVGANQESKPVTMPAEPGEYPYFCTLHPFLTGTVIVQ
jgi:plastocyanin